MTTEEMFNSLMEFSDDVKIIFKDIEGNIITKNRRFCLELEMANQSELFETKIKKCPGLPHSDQWLENDEKVMSTGKAHVFIENHEMNGIVGLNKTIKFPVFNKNRDIVGIGIIVKKI